MAPQSKYAAGPPPSGWQGKVRGTVPSESVALDDPGHTYHVLDDDKVVATSDPVLLAPHSAVSKRATAAKVKSEQEIIGACQRFEIMIGNNMARVADGAVQNLMSRVQGYVKVKVKPFAENERMVEDALKKLGGALYEQWAGRIGFKLEDINAILDRGGNIREAITLFNNFVQYILEPDIANNSLAGEAMVELLPEVRALTPDAEQRKAVAIQTYKDRKALTQSGVDSVQGNRDLGITGSLNETRTSQIQGEVPNTNPIETQMQAAGVAQSPDQAIPKLPQPGESNPLTGGDAHRTNRSGEKKRENDNWWMHEMTVDEFISLGGQLSAREKKLFNEGVYRQTLAAKKDTIVDETSFKQAIEAAETEAKKFVPWASGFMGYNLKFESTHAVMNAFNNLSVPVGAGVSGTTARTMHALQAVNIDATTSLKICLGYLLPMQAHSFSEVREAAAALGAGPYTAMRGSRNYNQAPIKGDVESTPMWSEFDRLFSPDAIGEIAKT